jgi:hypothetical protein
MEETVKTKKRVETKHEPDVEIFGESADSFKEERVDEKYTFNDRHHHHSRHGSLAFGLAFIIIGLLFLLSNFGGLPPEVLPQILKLWPVLIILIGVDTLVGHSEVSGIINSLIGVLFFVTVLGIIFIHTSPQVVNGLPQSVQNYLYSINNYLQIK